MPSGFLTGLLQKQYEEEQKKYTYQQPQYINSPSVTWTTTSGSTTPSMTISGTNLMNLVNASAVGGTAAGGEQ